MSSLIRFKPCGDNLWEMRSGHILVENYALELISKYRQVKKKTPESGGLLAGYYKGANIHIINLTVPQPADQCGRYHFHRQDRKHVKQLKEWYSASNKQINCLGEWHTHPENDPVPSSTDIKGWEIFNQDRSKQRAVFLIAGISSFWFGML